MRLRAKAICGLIGVLSMHAYADDKAALQEQLHKRMIEAIERHDLAEVKMLIAQGANINYNVDPRKSSWTEWRSNAVTAAAVKASPEILDFLLQKGADPNLAEKHIVSLSGAVISKSDIVFKKGRVIRAYPQRYPGAMMSRSAA